MSPMLLMVLTFLAVVLAIVGVWSLVSDLRRDQSRVSRRVDEQFRTRQRQRAQKSILFKDRGGPALDLMGEEETNPSIRQRLEMLIEQSGLEITPQRLLVYMVVCAVVAGLLAALLRRSLTVGLFVSGPAAVLPVLYVHLKRQARLAKMMRQMPDAFDLMARVIRAGQTISQAIQAVADEFDAPLAAEFSYCYEQQNLGLPPEVALRELARRTGLLEMKIFVLALLVQQQTGGNLAEMLEKLATVIRDRFRIRGKIQALTAEGRMQALVILALPPGMLGIILLLNPAYGGVLLEMPWALVAIAVSEAVGALWIRKIVNFDY